MTEENKFYVYIYYDPRKDPKEPFYVGKGHSRRMYDHLKEAENGVIHPKCQKIQAIQKAGLDPIIEKYKDNMTEEDAYSLEKKLIEEIGSNYVSTIKDGPLTNLIEGGPNGPSNMTTVIDINSGEKKFVSCSEYYKNDNLVSTHTGISIAKNINTGEISYVPTEEFKNRTDLVGVTYGKLVVLNLKTNKYESITVDEYKNNKDKYSAPSSGNVVVKDKITGKYKFVSKEEYRNNKDKYSIALTNKVSVK